jgi:hypothetical protein
VILELKQTDSVIMLQVCISSNGHVHDIADHCVQPGIM